MLKGGFEVEIKDFFYSHDKFKTWLIDFNFGNSQHLTVAVNLFS